jgi:hypothetical protein
LDLYETVQGDHLFRHLLQELASIDGAQAVRDEIWRIRSEVLSPSVKARCLLRYVELLARRAQEELAGPGRRPRRARPPLPPAADHPDPVASPFPAVGRDVTPARPRPHRTEDTTTGGRSA